MTDGIIDIKKLSPASLIDWSEEEKRVSFFSLIEVLTDAVAVIDANGVIQLINRALTDIFGYHPNELHAQSINVLMPDSYRDWSPCKLLNYLHIDESISGDLKRRITAERKGGERFPARVLVVRIAGLNPERFILVLQDITESQQIQRQLQRSEEELHLIIQNAPTPIATVSLDGYFIKVNRAWCHMLGYTESDLQKMHLREITHPDDIEKSIALLGEAREGKHDVYSFEKRYIHKDGQVLPVIMHNGIAHGPDGCPTMLIAQIQDLTERRLAEEEIREHRERLAHVDRLNIMGEMAASIAHEITQPLTAIVNRTSAAQRRLDAGQVDLERLQESLDRVSEQAHRAYKVIQHLRNLVRKRSGQRTVTPINSVLQEALRLAEVDARMHDTVIEMDLSDELRPVVIDTVQIQQVFLNLLRNAIDATEAAEKRGGVVTVRSTTDGEQAIVSVIDQGLGISDDTAARLFQPFFTTKSEGMGMGLSISQSIITGHGGRLWYEGNQEGGITFSFSMPIAATSNKRS